MSEPWRERVEVGDAVLYLGDCLKWLASVPPCFLVDAVVTDPPYGVEFSGKSGHYRNEPNAKRTDTYASYSDSLSEFADIVLPAIEMIRGMSRCAAVFMSSRNVFLLPQGDLGGFFLPNGCGLSSWGFQNFMHVVFYGKDPYLAAGKGCVPNGKYGLYGNDANQIPHPCAKPLAAMEWAVNRTSFGGETVCDPFMGSGTTGVACARLGRRFIGIEIERRYFDLACERITEAQRQGRLFDPPRQRAEQLALLPDAAT